MGLQLGVIAVQYQKLSSFLNNVETLNRPKAKTIKEGCHSNEKIY
jgi:hypothetical protein